MGSETPSHQVTKRIIARLDVKGDNVVRGIHLEGLRVVGKPEEMASRYYNEGIDEIIFIDTVATLYGRNNMLEVVERTAEHVFIPMTVGGGIRKLQDVEDALRAGADKITINSAAVRRPKLISEIARFFGSQCIVSAIEAKQCGPERWAVLIENGRESTDLDVLEWAKHCCELGAGEILLTSIDRDGTRKGFDLALIRKVAELVSIPIIATGGAGTTDHIVEAFREGQADAVALGSILHFNLTNIRTIKEHTLRSAITVRAVADNSHSYA